MGFKTRVKGTPAQIGNVYKERPGLRTGRRRGSGADVGPQTRSVDSMKAPESPKHEMVIHTTPGTKVKVLHDKKHNPTEISMTELKDPHSGAPLEPALGYGSTTLYSPHSGHFTNLDVPGSEPVESRFAGAHRKSQMLAMSYVSQAADKVRTSNREVDVKEAFRLFEHAQRIEPWHQYPEADLQKDPVYIELKESGTMISNDIQSARESTGTERQKYLNSARRRMLACEAALSGKKKQ
jgi:hypothetical protein